MLDAHKDPLYRMDRYVGYLPADWQPQRTGSSAPHKLGQGLRHRDQMAAREGPAFVSQFAPQAFEAAFVSGQAGDIAVCERTFIETSLPGRDGGGGSGVRTAHRSQADLSAVRDIPIRCKCQLGL